VEIEGANAVGCRLRVVVEGTDLEAGELRETRTWRGGVGAADWCEQRDAE